MSQGSLTPAQFQRLTALNAELTRIISLQQQRGVDGTFRPGAAITPRALRAAWSTVGKGRNRSALRDKVLAILRPKPDRIVFKNFTMVRKRPVVQLDRRPAGLKGIEAATARNITIKAPGELQTAVHVSKRPIVRRAITKVAKIATGAAAGYIVGKRHGGLAGAVTGGAVGGILLSDPNVRRNIGLATAYARKLTTI